MSNIQICVHAVLPLFIYILIGVLVRRTGMMNDAENKRFNKILFTFFYPVLLFSNIYDADLSVLFDIKLITFALVFVLISVVTVTAVILRIEKGSAARGAMIQAIYRSNFVLMGVMIVDSIFGDEGLPVVSMLVTIVVPVFNIIAVVVLETFRGGRADVKDIALNVIKNPLILGAAAGVLYSLSGLGMPYTGESVITGIADATPPMALIMLGVSFDPAAVRAKRRDIVICVFGRLIAVPAIGLPLAAAMGFRGPAFVSLLIMMASPTAVSSYPMAVALDSDADIAGSAVMISTPLSCITLFIWLLIFRTAGVF